MEILFKNAAFLTSRIFASAMIRVFPSLEHSTGHVRTPKTICRTVFGVPDMSPSDCPNVEETRNPMQISGRKKCSHFFTKNIPSAFHLKSKGMILLSYFFSCQTGLPA